MFWGTSLKTSIDYGTNAGMDETRKITVEVSERTLELAQEYTGAGISETVRAALADMASRRAQKKALALRGKVKFSMTYEEMRNDRE